MLHIIIIIIIIIIVIYIVTFVVVVVVVATATTTTIIIIIIIIVIVTVTATIIIIIIIIITIITTTLRVHAHHTFHVQLETTQCTVYDYVQAVCGDIVSGGTQRKLSVAVAIMAMPPVLLLDEPTAGLDPVSRRHVWDVLASFRASGHTIVLTSHR